MQLRCSSGLSSLKNLNVSEFQECNSLPNLFDITLFPCISPGNSEQTSFSAHKIDFFTAEKIPTKLRNAKIVDLLPKSV